ncbi:MAG TPA: hypothetical protein VGB30_05895 [bacterium]|jgi:hypothetical protein
MSAQLKVYEDSSCTEETLIRYENLIGTALSDATILDSPNQGAGNAPPDELTLNISYDSGNSEWDVDVTRKDGSSYHVDDITTSGSNINNIIPGVDITIGSLDTGQSYQAKVYIGWNPGIIVAGSQSTDKRFWVKNIGNEDGTDARIRILPDGDFTNDVNTPIKAIAELKYQTDTASGTYVVTVKSDTSKVDVVYEGNPPVEKSIVADGATENEIATGIYVVFNSGLSEDDEGTIEISSGHQRVLIAPDNSGTPGTFSTSDVVFGNLDVDDIDSFWARLYSLSSDSPTGNPRHANLQARITSI